MLRIHGHLIGFNNNFTIYDQSDSTKLVRNCMRDSDIDTKQYSPKRIQAHISSLKNQRIFSNHLKAKRHFLVLQQKVAYF